MQAFQDALMDCSLEDIGYHGDKFTFFRGGLRERLDRAVSNADWMEMHPLCGLIDDGLLSTVKPVVTPQMNALLVAPYTKDEVKKALFQIGDELTKEVLDAINNKKIPDGWNSTNVVLIPKVDSPEMIPWF
ncbi:uncharacterized protein [Aegilops tauschii subsp. strangulata]|uniref:uncharacterized protein n=1 Tax=Aegilops tauschii subsp. strangulata TaxID=200361 RepID=UPI003CC86F61